MAVEQPVSRVGGTEPHHRVTAVGDGYRVLVWRVDQVTGDPALVVQRDDL